MLSLYPNLYIVYSLIKALNFSNQLFAKRQQKSVWIYNPNSQNILRQFLVDWALIRHMPSENILLLGDVWTWSGLCKWIFIFFWSNLVWKWKKTFPFNLPVRAFFYHTNVFDWFWIFWSRFSRWPTNIVPPCSLTTLVLDIFNIIIWKWMTIYIMPKMTKYGSWKVEKVHKSKMHKT